MAGPSFEITGIETLAKELNKLPDVVAVRAGKAGAMKAAQHLRKDMRRSAPMSKLMISPGPGKAKKKYSMFNLIRAKRLKRLVPPHGVGARVTGNGLLRVFEQGRRAYTRKSGHTYAASPQMARFDWWHKAVERHAPEAIQVMIDHTKAAIVTESIKIYRKTLRGK